MSYDIELLVYTAITGQDGESESVTVYDVGNYTSNVAPMWSAALGRSLGDLHGRSAGACVVWLTSAVKDMKREPDKYKAMNPKNGWGDYEGALAYLENLLHACKILPNTTVWIDH